ncbi:putative BOI-related E3 ubiquitin-protein ligase 2 [Panicum miliaceum]|uniref:BOI-related E3 ubiquitin-protein ligase 2 n=1 Tax=Panicum miliaceum TaxID=4540 RepID=A0A3L6RVP1_PANMI|nr:putative BOI-related E3 ubiquitin-protein ligase 2 [Panicum miliaceum]
MAVHARYLAHAFPHDPRAITSSPALDIATGASAFLGEHGCGGHKLAAAVAGNTVFSDITCNNNDSGSLGPRKRARVGNVAGAGLTMDLQGQRALLPPVPLSVVPQAFPPAGDAQNRVLCSGAASTSGRQAGPATVSQGVLSHIYSNGVEIDALVRIEVRRPVSSPGSVANAVSFLFGLSGTLASSAAIRGLIPFSVLVTGFCAGRPSGCGRGCRRRGAGTRAPRCRRRNAPRRGACARRRPTWGARWRGTRSWTRGSGRRSPRRRRGRPSPGATRPPPRASVPRSTTSCSLRAPPTARALAPTATPRTPGRAALGRSRAAPRRGARRGRAGRAARRTRACCCCRAGTCACAAGATRPRRPAPCARPPRTPRSTSCSPDD